MQSITVRINFNPKCGWDHACIERFRSLCVNILRKVLPPEMVEITSDT
jgi:hypothetical protein